jgi:hypothetical protein
MKHSAKLVVIFVFALCAFAAFLKSADLSRIGTVGRAETVATPTPPVSNTRANANTAPNTNAATNTNTAVNTNTAKPPANGGASIPATFTLAKDSQSENGEAPFNHDAHAFKNYSPDGKSVMGCVECHHTDQPKSALKPPDVTSERNVTLTFDVWKTSSQKVSECRACHFQDGNVPDGKAMPTATYPGGVTKEMNNQLAFHINCNTCHDAAFKLRPELKSKPGFATSKDCSTCHKTN